MSSKTQDAMSIGEVLKALKEEFPDISVSKIRFLESEGLIEPDRTVSGYRQFQEGDLARLRYILRLQRDHYMPLKVIRQRLDSLDPDDPGDQVERPAAAGPPPPAQAVRGEDDDWSLDGGVSLDASELAHAAGLEAEDIRSLEDFGLLEPQATSDGPRYDEDDLMVAKLAREFAKHGIEARHLRMFRNFVDRVSGLFEQIVMPRAGNETHRKTLRDLARLSRRLSEAMLRARLRRHLKG